MHSYVCTFLITHTKLIWAFFSEIWQRDNVVCNGNETNHFYASFVCLCECIEGVCLGKMHGIFIYLFSSASGGEIPEGKHQRAFRCGTVLSSWGKAKHLLVATVLLIMSGAGDKNLVGVPQCWASWAATSKGRRVGGKRNTRTHMESQSNWWEAGELAGELASLGRAEDHWLSFREVVFFSQL